MAVSILPTPQFLHAALPRPGGQPRWRGRARARGRIFMHAELGGNLLVKERWLGFRNGMTGSLEYASKEREARLLTKGEQLPCSGCVKAFPSFTPGQCQWAGENGQVAE